MNEAEVIYAVALDVDAGVIGRYLVWLRAHMRQIVALPGFVGAQLFEQDEPPAQAGRVNLCVQYTLRDEQALATYLREHAPRLRAEGEALFGGHFRASRQVLRRIDRA
jgi:Domain of unknown function (DUF4286)